MKDSVLRELASMAFAEGARGEAARKYALEDLPKSSLRKYIRFLRNEIIDNRVTVRIACAADEDIRKSIGEIFRGSDVKYEVDHSFGAGMEIEHGDNIIKANVKSILDRAIHRIKESL